MITSNKCGIYVHIPYCVRKCNYCDFISFEDRESSDEYINSLINEIKNRSNGKTVDTIFIGGGTPSCLEADNIGSILEAISDGFDVADGSEITIEANPGTFTMDKLKKYRESGINRISIGVQSFNDDALRILGRIHDKNQAENAFHMARDAGFTNINFDLMFAFMGLFMETWQETLEHAVTLSPEHISFYSLQLEENTKFYDMFLRGEFEQTDEILDRKMYHFAVDYLKSEGYGHYEVSNAAKPGKESRHNLKYWSMTDYMGFGIGASSFENGIRIVNTDSLSEYIEGNGNKGRNIHVNTEFDNASEFVFTGLRKTEGIKFKDFKEYTGKNFFDIFPDAENKILKWEKEGLVIFSGDGIRFTLNGFDVQNSILMEFV